MALIDRARDVYFDRARERWKQKGFDADITDILEDYRAETNKKIKREKVNVLSTFLISLYDYDHDSLQLDITKLSYQGTGQAWQKQADDKRRTGVAQSSRDPSENPQCSNISDGV